MRLMSLLLLGATALSHAETHPFGAWQQESDDTVHCMAIGCEDGNFDQYPDYGAEPEGTPGGVPVVTLPDWPAADWSSEPAAGAEPWPQPQAWGPRDDAAADRPLPMPAKPTRQVPLPTETTETMPETMPDPMADESAWPAYDGPGARGAVEAAYGALPGFPH